MTVIGGRSAIITIDLRPEARDHYYKRVPYAPVRYDDDDDDNMSNVNDEKRDCRHVYVLDISPNSYLYYIDIAI